MNISSNDPELMRQREESIASMDPNAIPDLDQMLVKINELLEFIEKPESVNMMKRNKNDFEDMIIKLFGEDIPNKIITLMLEDDRYDNLAKLLDMFDILRKVKNQQADIQEEFHKFNENLNEQYLYPKFGGKEEFENRMKNGNQ